MPKTTFALLLLALAAQVRSAPVRLAATPALSPDGSILAFEWQNDLWAVPSTGGVARALTRHEAVDRFPVFSPDGRSIAFMSERDGTAQTWRMDLADGTARQLTFHADGAVPQDWSPDGRFLLVRATRDSGDFHPHRLHTIPAAEGGRETPLFDEPADWARWSPDGSRILFMRHGEDPYRRGYRGSKAATVWTFTPATQEFALLARAKSGADCRWPLWLPDGKSFLHCRESDDGRTFNLWRREVGGGRDTALTTGEEEAVMFPAVSRDGRVVVFRRGFDFYRLEPASGRPPARIPVEAPPDATAATLTRLTYMSTVNYDDPAHVDFSPDGEEVVFTSGANLWVMDTKVREPVAVTTGSGAQDNWAFFDAKAERILFLRDTGDRVNFWQAERADPTLPWWRNSAFKLTALTDDARARSGLEPDAQRRRFAWNEGFGELWIGTPGSNDHRRVVASCDEVSASWSPDGRWLALSVEDSEDNRDVWIHAADGSRPPYNLSRQPDWDGNAVWSPDGRLIAFISRSFDQRLSIRYAWMRREDHGLTERETAVLRDPPSNAKDTRIDFEDLHERVTKVGVAVSNPSGLFWSWDGKALGFQGTVDGKTGTWKTFFPHPEKSEFVSALRGDWVEWRANGIRWSVDGVPHEFDRKLGFTVRLQRDEAAWRRLAFRKMWRILRDRFYDEKLNNLDWNAVLAKLEPVAGELDATGFARLAAMLFGELNASHLDFTPAKAPVVPGYWKRQTGHIGARFEAAPAAGGLRVREVIPGSPADRSATRLLPGDIVTDARDLDAFHALLEGPLPREVTLTVQRGGSNHVVRLPAIAGDDIRELARTAEERVRRERTHAWSQGRLGYVNIRSMKTENLRQFEDEVYSEGFGRDGLVIDVRNNTGGFTADSILNILLYPQHAVTIPRGGEPGYQGGYLRRPRWNKPVTVLCNAYTASNGEIFSHAIRSTGRGRLVGVPTQGAVISTGERSLLDLGTFRVPGRGWFSLPGGQDMERVGAQPDLVVENPPDARMKGEDPQLKAAVETLLQDLRKAPGLPRLQYGSGRTIPPE